MTWTRLACILWMLGLFAMPADASTISPTKPTPLGKPSTPDPDVVYRFAPEFDMSLEIDLWGSNYDTKVYVYGAGMELVACNDDFYPNYVSKIEYLSVVEGTKYYIVIDGYGGDHGDYVISMFTPPPADKSAAGEVCRRSTVKSLFD